MRQRSVFNLLAGVLIFGTILSARSLNQKAPVSWSEASLLSAAQAQTPPNIVDQMTLQGQIRTYRLHTPETYDAEHPLPLVVALHGSGELGQDMETKTGLSQLADQEGFIAAYPDALNKDWNVDGTAPEDNVAFIQALIAHIQQIRTIDPQRIYLVGVSDGGLLAQKIACENPGQIAAIVTVAASLPVEFANHCQANIPVPMLMINGTADEIVPWDGGSEDAVQLGQGISIPPMPEVAQFWQQHNQCLASPRVSQRGNLVTVESYGHCKDHADVVLMALKGAGHIWAGSMGPSAYLNTTEVAWNFFERHALESDPFANERASR